MTPGKNRNLCTRTRSPSIRTGANVAATAPPFALARPSNKTSGATLIWPTRTAAPSAAYARCSARTLPSAWARHPRCWVNANPSRRPSAANADPCAARPSGWRPRQNKRPHRLKKVNAAARASKSPVLFPGQDAAFSAKRAVNY